jgi:hypothetical protein
MYLLLSAISGFVELGALTYAVLQGWSLSEVLALGCAYQLGALANSVVRLSRVWFLAVLAVAAGTCLLDPGPPAFAAAMILLSIGLQGIREEALTSGRVGTLAKRISRIVGFAAAGLCSPTATASAALLAVAIGITLPRASSTKMPHTSLVPAAPRSIDVIMLVHQAHYFAYAYALPILFLRTYRLSPIAASLAFSLGWTSYSATPTILARCPARLTLILGHLLAAATLGVIALRVQHIEPLLVAWFVIGFGGGTVFLIRRLEATWKPPRPTSQLDVWENVGHVAGVLVAIVVTLRAASVVAMIVAGAVLALSTAILVFIAEPGTVADRAALRNRQRP